MRKFVLAAVLILVAGGAQAATLNIRQADNQLLGASGVVVGGSLYDVEFVNLSCLEQFSGCDDVSDFAFSNATDATLASQALLDQVFLDVGLLRNYDSNSYQTEACNQGLLCKSFTPYSVNVGSDSGSVAVAYNYGIDHLGIPAGSDSVGFDSFGRADELTNYAEKTVWAFWSPSAAIPEPNTALLLGLGLTGLAAKGRRRNRS
jgi:hypothetical protein